MADIMHRNANTRNTGTGSAARWFARIIGVVLVLVGIWGFFTRDPLGINFELTNLHNWVHILTGAVALYYGFAPVSETHVANFAKIFGAVYLLLGIIGFFVDSLFGGALILTMADNVLHLLIGVAGLAAGFMTAPRGDESRTRARRPVV